MNAETLKRMKAELKRSLPEILEGRDPYRVNDYRIFTLGIDPIHFPETPGVVSAAPGHFPGA